MNQTQRRVIFGGVAMIIFMLLFPPFHVDGKSRGFSLLFLPPSPVAGVDIYLLLVEWLAVILVCSALVLAFRDKTD